MHVVVIHGWKEESSELVQALAGALGIMVFEARQRIIGGGPSVISSFADTHQAGSLAAKLNQSGISTLIIDSATIRGRADTFQVSRFELGERSLHIETDTGQHEEIPYGEIEMLLPCTSVTELAEMTTVTERKFSIGKTIVSGGIPITTKVQRQEEVRSEKHEKFLRLYAGSRPLILFSQNGMIYDGFGAAMKLSQELNFAYLLSELHRLSPGAVYDDRLISRAMQARLLGPVQNMAGNIDLAAEILVRSLRAEIADSSAGS